MKSLQVTSPGEFRLLDLPVPEPGAGELLLRVEAVTTCPQWDLHLRHNEPMFVGHQFEYPYAPGQPGHEATGSVAALGPGVSQFAVGDRVSAWRDPGHTGPGCYAQFVVKKAEEALRVPAHLPPEATAPLELAMCVGAVFLMLREMDAVRGRRFGVSGLGPAGLIAAMMARAEGAGEVVGLDLSPQRREGAVQAGVVDAAYAPGPELEARFPGRGADEGFGSAVDCVGAKRSVEYLMDHTHDVVALFGVQREEYTFALRHYMNLRLCGYRGHSREAAEYALGLMERGHLDLSRLVTHHLPLERYNDGIALLEAQEAVKVCFWPWREE